MPGPTLQRPTYLSGAPVTGLSPAVSKIASAAKPLGGLLVGAVVGAVAAYFVPRALDHYFEGHQSDNVELDVEP